MQQNYYWRDDLDALVFHFNGHAAVCMVHRLAFRKFLGRMLTSEVCLSYFVRHQAIFEAAALAKVARKSLSANQSLHLTSRDISALTA